MRDQQREVDHHLLEHRIYEFSHCPDLKKEPIPTINHFLKLFSKGLIAFLRRKQLLKLSHKVEIELDRPEFSGERFNDLLDGQVSALGSIVAENIRK